ncbi:DUF4350 domain-containing protein [Brachybacterium fresconis]|uniref:Membrane protein implicated in regulation of membrane protease activity n=1 Tax=Brachybacterium fresconis TaxID=173363 RepID=A0ABS4YHA7_9MICO|nr:DUF4350 domain-containing protein [Brachybacterium fresconis]MBP2408183.1 membrane protein implicated in regulation of membrane protease activity [Brachybacterium fresconis]
MSPAAPPRTAAPSAPAPTIGGAAAPGTTGGTAAPGPEAPAAERRRPWLVILVTLAVLAAVLASVARGFYRDGPLEPDAPTAQGSKAVVQVLEDLDVEVDVDRHTTDATEALHGGGTVLVTAPSSLSAQQLTTLADAREAGDGRLVLVEPDFVSLSYLTSDIAPAGSLRTATDLSPDPGCGDLAHGARTLHVPGADGLYGPSTLYRTSGPAQGCFGSGEGSLIAAADGILVLGSADLLTNEGIAAADNSALALNALGSAGELTWYIPSPSDPMSTSGQTILGYLPSWAGPLALWLLAVAAIALIALGRRFGPVVVEPLPVTVRPQELVLGRARMLQQSGSRDAAAASLRSASATRLADRLGLRRESALEGLLAALAPHVDHTPEQLSELLGPTPVTSDQDLVHLAQDLDRLEKEIDR